MTDLFYLNGISNTKSNGTLTEIAVKENIKLKIMDSKSNLNTAVYNIYHVFQIGFNI